MRTIAIILGVLVAIVGMVLLISGNSWIYIFHGAILLFLGTGIFMVVSYKDVILNKEEKKAKKKV